MGEHGVIPLTAAPPELRRARSMFAWGATARLLPAAGVAVCLWLAVAWALDWW